MSTKDFKKISHPEPKILKSLFNCAQTLRHSDTQTDGQMGLDLEQTPLPGGSAKNS